MADHSSEARRIGDNVRSARLFRGLSLEALAGLVGRSKGWLSQVETGKTRLDKRSDIRALAVALEVSASDLLGEPSPTIPDDRQYGSVARLRQVLLDYSLDDPPDVPARPLSVLGELAAGPIREQRRADDDAALTSSLPPVLMELHVHAATGDEEERVLALRLIIELCSFATFTLRHLGQIDLAWIASDRAERAARMLDDPVMLGAAGFAQAHSRSSAELTRALQNTERTADLLESCVGDDRFAHEVHGMLHLSAALARQIEGDSAGALERVEEAERIADRLGENPDAWMSFGPANVGTWRTSLAVEAGRPETALEAGQAVDVKALATRGRRAALAIDQGRALAMLGDDSGAVRSIRQAEKLSVTRVRKNPLVRELVADLYDRAPGRDLRGLAWRMNLI
jgi:transcriptional regulator with XRE-family HTH domain